ncbi:bifunctional phosphopantothenoylcysteine decarboxylase/phosphopantothenate--cysteine ligase CoaBC [Opitutus sp. ER46]|uniref:bifunctional phosphopantothenoylcysteine decarboxylase/phosphopantothenate--cysteine ligase CoaBC n=1 Tax=Opitutus sp. ER46 TaxID=2161864 RepID=UPI000D301A13|nr:bifunctional phosphopantothenoylcysteine decarboxylase/phosphopantothenate--cysteine ligase CoaBC [Opitutus sp. ER46]PTX91767.1 bifunctional phosphopantothenoylcysteine decarboxylase/phosphopantothenate--cysteine ligase CoaBC [Opitutus sp. ER46]
MSNVLFILTGSIACYKACEVISQLVQRGHHVRPVASAAALRFVGATTLEALTHEKVRTDLWAEGEALDHINLDRWADVTVVCPATANTLNALAAGLADNLVGSLLLAHDPHKPLLVAPAMNPAMWKHPATVAASRRLRSWGVQFIEPAAGRTACGEVGEGRLAEPETIVAAIDAALVRPEHRLRVLVTSGGTSEPIDGVRVLTNISTGATGAGIAEHFSRLGHDVLLVRAATSVPLSAPGREETYGSFGDLDAVLERRLREEHFDVVIHAAAVSDYAIEAIEVDGQTWRPGAGKIPSQATPLIRLRRNPKLLDKLRSCSLNPAIRVVAFKLTKEADDAAMRAAVEAILAHGTADYVVQNDLAQREPDGAFPADIWGPQRTIVAHCRDRADIALALATLLS